MHMSMLLSACLVLLKFTSWNPNIQCDTIKKNGVFERWLVHEGRALMNEIMTHKRDPTEPLSPYTMWGYEKSATPKRVLIWPYSTLRSNVQPPELWKINFYCFWDTQPGAFCYSIPNIQYTVYQWVYSIPKSVIYVYYKSSLYINTYCSLQVPQSSFQLSLFPCLQIPFLLMRTMTPFILLFF